MPRPGVASPHVPDAGAATPEHAQGPGLDLQAGTYVPPPAFLDLAAPPAGQGFTVVGDYNHDYKSEHTVTVSVPVTIRLEIKRDAAAISRDIGARTGREVRKALSDASIPE